MRLHTGKAIAIWLAVTGLAASLLTLAACHVPTPKPVATAESGSGTPPRTSTQYQIDGAASRLHVLAYRAGALARLGHNHVLSTDKLTGSVVIDPQLDRSQLLLTLPVDSFSVDDPQARAQEGEEFSADVPTEAREATRGNLFRPEVLNAAKFPTITLRSLRVAGTHHDVVLTVSVTLRDVTRQLEIPVTVSYQAGQLTARGEFALKQTDFGMTPFSAGMGALQVRDELLVRFSILARA